MNSIKNGFGIEKEVTITKHCLICWSEIIIYFQKFTKDTITCILCKEICADPSEFLYTTSNGKTESTTAEFCPGLIRKQLVHYLMWMKAKGTWRENHLWAISYYNWCNKCNSAEALLTLFLIIMTIAKKGATKRVAMSFKLASKCVIVIHSACVRVLLIIIYLLHVLSLIL